MSMQQDKQRFSPSKKSYRLVNVHLLLELLREKVDGVDMGVTTGESSGFGVGGSLIGTGGWISSGTSKSCSSKIG